MSSKFHLDLTPEEGILLLTGARLLDKLVAGIRIQSADRDELIDEVISKVAGHVPMALNRLSGEIADAIVDAVAGSPQTEESEILTDLSDNEHEDSCAYPMYAVEGLLPVIEKAISTKSSFVIDYYSFAQETINFYTLDTFDMVQEEDLWKMIAYCHERDQIMIFRVDRIKNLVETDQKFEVPEGFDPDQPFPFAG